MRPSLTRVQKMRFINTFSERVHQTRFVYAFNKCAQEMRQGHMFFSKRVQDACGKPF